MSIRTATALAAATTACIAAAAPAGLPPAPAPVPGSLLDRGEAPPASGTKREGKDADRASPKERADKRKRERPVKRPDEQPTFSGSSMIDVDTARLPLIDELVTRSGRWRLLDAGRDRDLSRYVWTLDANPRFVRVMACKRAFTHERGDGKDLDLTKLTARVRHGGNRHQWTMSVAQGACRIVQNMEPVQPRAEWLRQAVASFRIPAYRREASLRRNPVSSALEKAGAYDPTSLGGNSSSRNYVGVTSAQGGEYKSSRSFIHDADARIVDAVLHGADVDRSWPAFTAYSFYSLSHPQGAVWSAVNHVSVDPQIPQAGDRPWEISNAARPVRNDIDSVVQTNRWSRDLPHLENTGFVHWIMTEDPVAGLVVQRQAAYALASFYEYRRKPRMQSYAAYDEQQRGTYNLLSALWKSRDVAQRVRSRRGSVIWRPDRTEKMAGDIIDDIDARLVQPMLTAGPGDGRRYLRRIVGLPLSSAGKETWRTLDGGKIELRGTSAFMLPRYGKEPLYLWTRAGNRTVGRWFAVAARHLVVRMLHIGGARGTDQSKSVRGSSFPVAPTEDPLPFTNDVGWARWALRLPIKAGPTDSFDGASLALVTDIWGTLRLAKAAGVAVPELDDALRRMDANWKRTTAPSAAASESAKHWASPR
jgi:hypothetical protein